jgi:NTE family protein
LLVAMSGGGKRSAAFAYGALKGMRQATIPGDPGNRTLLRAADEITRVSGGSFGAAYYGLYRDKAFGQYEKAFLVLLQRLGSGRGSSARGPSSPLKRRLEIGRR